MIRACPICGHSSLATLPTLAEGRAVLSDGRVVLRNLTKCSCIYCGAVTHAHPLGAQEISEIYDENYTLGSHSAIADERRGRAYADWICERVGDIEGLRVLEVGCGTGSLLMSLASKAQVAVAVGVDPALPTQSDVSGVTLIKGWLENVPDTGKNFDLIITVNVIEHVFEPAAFLAALSRRLRPSGRIIVICPAAEPSVELLFLDHVTTFTPKAMQIVAARAECRVARSEPAPVALGAFQQFIIESSAPDGSEPLLASKNLVESRTRYLKAWKDLDMLLQKQVSSDEEICLFGAAETAMLIRGYAPETWSRVSFLTADQPEQSWAFDRPVRRYSEIEPSSRRTMIVAVAPGGQALVAARLRDDGHRPLAWESSLEYGVL